VLVIEITSADEMAESVLERSRLSAEQQHHRANASVKQTSSSGLVQRQSFSIHLAGVQTAVAAQGRYLRHLLL